MKYTPGPMIGAASGSIGGNTASRNRYGAYWRTRAIPVTSTTTDALAAKARFSTYSANWSALTAAQRLSWNNFAQTHPTTDALGQSQILTGHTVYVGINTRLAQAGESAIDIPPLEPDPIGLVTLSGTWDIGIGNFEVIFTATPLGANDVLIVRAAVVGHAGINYVENLLRIVGFSAKAQASLYDTQSLIEAKFGTLIVGDIVHLDLRVLDTLTGLVSSPMKVVGTVVST